jgi:glycosyltransferase involved in cell wall biosynthesis
VTKKVLIVQRVLTSYRFDLLQELAPLVAQLGFVTSQGDSEGSLKAYKPKNIKYNNIKIISLDAFKLKYKGDSRGTSLFFYPQILKHIKNYDTIVLEGTTNLLNNLFIIPWAKMLGKKVLWWDAGYSLEQRTFKRKIIDKVVYPFIKMTDCQLAYSTKAQKYMQKYMGAKSCHLLLNTINTEYFDKIQNEIREHLQSYQFNKEQIKFLYVGAIEERKKVLELIKLVDEMNSKKSIYQLTIIGGGDYLETLKKYVVENDIVNIEFTGAIYDKSILKQYYFDSDLFVLPGDGGLGILQSLLYGLPTVCLAADGTEEDYMSSEFILSELNDIKKLDIEELRDAFKYEKLYEKVNSSIYIKKFNNKI